MVDALLLLLQGQFCFFFCFPFVCCHVLYVPFLNQYMRTSEIVVHLITKIIFILYSFYIKIDLEVACGISRATSLWFVIVLVLDCKLASEFRYLLF